MKENSFSQDTPAFDVVLAQTIARHFQGAVAEAIDGVQTVRLGNGLPVIECFIDTIQDHEPYGAFLFLQITSGAFGDTQTLVTASGYGSSQLASVVTAGCNWACAFGPALLAGIGRPDLISSQDPEFEQCEATVGGRRYRVSAGHVDRSMNMPIESDDPGTVASGLKAEPYVRVRVQPIHKTRQAIPMAVNNPPR